MNMDANDNTKKIAILIPAHNAEKTISRAMKSVMMQSYHNWQMYVIDDNSQDNTIDVAKRIAHNDSRIKVLSLPVGCGKTYALRYGIDNIDSADYVMFLDSDDTFNGYDLFKKLICEINAEGAECVCFNIITKEKLSFPYLKEKVILSSDKEICKNIMNRRYIDGNLTGGLYDFSSVKDNFVAQDFNHEDFINKYQMINKCKKVLIVPIIGYKYYVNMNGITHKKIQDKDKYYYIHAKEFADSIYSRYPDLKKECDYFSNWVLLWIASRLADNNDSKGMNMYRTIMNAAKKNFRIFIHNPYFTSKDRITYLLIQLRLYRIGHALYLKVR